MFSKLRVAWTNILSFSKSYRRDITVASALLGALFSAIASYNAWSSAAASTEVARKAAAVQAAVAFEDKVHRYPAAGACMQAVINSDNRNDVIDRLARRESFEFKWAQSVNNGRRVAFCVINQESSRSDDAKRIAQAQQHTATTEVVDDIFMRTMRQLSAYEGILLYFTMTTTSPIEA
jgi:hypothetical protein